MVSRGEVALIVASKGASVGLMSSALFGPVIVVVVATTIISPILLKIAYRNDRKEEVLVDMNDEENELSA
jgi:Kef-type K+ transport system membrane component KefB